MSIAARRFIGAGLLAAVAWGPMAARAAPAPDRPAAVKLDPAIKKKAREHFAKGGEHYAKERFPKAIEEFKKAYSYWKNPRILLNIAICYSEMNDAVQGVIYLRRARKTATPEQLVKLRTKVPKGLREREGQVADLEVVMPSGAEIYVNDKLAGSSPAQVVVLPGTVRVSVKQSGQVKVSKTLVIKAGEKKTFALTQWPVTAPPKKTKPSWRKRLAKLPVYYVGAAALITLVGAVALIGTGVRTEQIQDDYYGNPNMSTHDRGVRYRTATNVLIGITVTAGLAAGVLALFTDWSRLPWKKEKSSTTKILPSAGPGGVGLSASGSF